MTKKLLFIFFLSLLTYESHSQWFLGYSEDEVMTASQKTGGIKQRKLVDDNGTMHVLWDILDPFTTFDAVLSNGLVTEVYLVPQNQYSRDSWYNVIDRDYYKVSKATWKGYQNNQEFYIQYFKMPSGVMEFRIGKTPRQ